MITINIIATYTAEDATADGIFTRGGMCKGEPVYVTAGVSALLQPGDFERLIADFITWDRDTRPTLQEEDWLFTTSLHTATVWVDEVPGQITVLLPEEY